MFRLYVYADSSNLAAIEENLLREFTEFASNWPVREVSLTNRKAPLVDGQLVPDWNLGLRVTSSVLTRENVEQLLSFVARLSREFGLPFVLGTWRQRTVETQDLCFVDRQVPDGAAGVILQGASAA